LENSESNFKFDLSNDNITILVNKKILQLDFLKQVLVTSKEQTKFTFQ